MLTETFIAATAREGRALLDAVKAAPDAPVAACPGWDNLRLLRHVGAVHRMATNVITTRASTQPDRDPADKPPDSEPWDWYRDGLSALVDALRSTPQSEPMWSWTDRRDAGFYHRRMAHETTVHRYDAESAAGTPAHIDGELAADGVSEVLAVGMRYRREGTVEYPDSSLLLVRTDGAERWLLRAVDGTLMVAHNGDAGNRADAICTGPAEYLLLHLWGRHAPGLSISGDEGAAAAWASVAP